MHFSGLDQRITTVTRDYAIWRRICAENGCRRGIDFVPAHDAYVSVKVAKRVLENVNVPELCYSLPELAHIFGQRFKRIHKTRAGFLREQNRVISYIRADVPNHVIGLDCTEQRLCDRRLTSISYQVRRYEGCKTQASSQRADEYTKGICVHRRNSVVCSMPILAAPQRKLRRTELGTFGTRRRSPPPPLRVAFQ